MGMHDKQINKLVEIGIINIFAKYRALLALESVCLIEENNRINNDGIYAGFMFNGHITNYMDCNCLDVSEEDAELIDKIKELHSHSKKTTIHLDDSLLERAEINRKAIEDVKRDANKTYQLLSALAIKSNNLQIFFENLPEKIKPFFQAEYLSAVKAMNFELDDSHKKPLSEFKEGTTLKVQFDDMIATLDFYMATNLVI